jgi:hypothetical protein
MKHLSIVVLVLFLISCGKKENTNYNTSSELIASIETITLLGDTLRSPEPKPGKALDNYLSAKRQFLNNPVNYRLNHLVWS